MKEERRRKWEEKKKKKRVFRPEPTATGLISKVLPSRLSCLRHRVKRKEGSHTKTGVSPLS
jgi:hypothetical protein